VADDLGDAIVSNAQGPRAASGDLGSVHQHSLPEMIEADQYVRATKAVSRPGRGIRFSRIAAPGAITRPCP
jgi:hypothetical protein